MLEDTIAALAPAARWELWSVTMIVRGDHAEGPSEAALAEARSGLA